MLIYDKPQLSGQLTSIEWPPAKGGRLMGGGGGGAQQYYIILKTAKSGLVSKWRKSKLH